jgi:hypothetical protein
MQTLTQTLSLSHTHTHTQTHVHYKVNKIHKYRKQVFSITMAKVNDSDIELAEKGKSTADNDTKPTTTETGNPMASSSPRKNLSKTDTQVQRELDESEKARINAEFVTNPSFKAGVCRMQALFRGRNHRRQVEQKKFDIIMDFQKSIEERSPLFDMCVFLIFMMFFVFAVMWRVDYDSHYFVQIMRDWVIEEEFSTPETTIYKNFGDVASEEEFWQYLEGPFAGNMFPDEGSEFFYGTAVVGSVRLRQIRVSDSGESGCYVPNMMKNEFAKECYQELNDNKASPGYNIAKERFGNATAIANVRNASSDEFYKHFVESFEYDEEKEARVTLYEAWRNTYPSKGGYIVRMPSNMGNAAAGKMIHDLKANGWVDGATRAVIIEFAAYNKQTMIFVQTKLFVEFFTTGGAFTYPQFSVCKLATVGTEMHLQHQQTALLFRIIVFVFVLALIIQEFRELYQEGAKNYFRSIWNYIDLINYGIFVIQMFYFASYYSFQEEIRIELEGTDTTKFIDIGYLSQLYNYVDYIAAMNMLLSTLKIFQYLEANKGMATIIYTLAGTTTAVLPLLVFLVMFVSSFSIAIYVGFNTIDYNLRSLRITFITLLKSAFGVESGEWESKIMISDRTIGTGIIFAYRLVVGFFLISMVVTIVDVAYNEMKDHLDEAFDNDVLVASLRIKLNNAYQWLAKMFPSLPKPNVTAIPLSQALKASQDKKKKYFQWSTDERLAMMEKSLRRERSLVEQINKDVKEEKDLLRTASRASFNHEMPNVPLGDTMDVIQELKIDEEEITLEDRPSTSPSKANRRKSRKQKQ